METLFAIKCKEHVLLAADAASMHSLLLMKDDEDKIYKLSEKLLLAICGEKGDTSQYAEYIAKNIQLYRMRNGYDLSPEAAATFTRGNLAEYLRTRTPYNVNMLLCGYDDEKGPRLYFIDYLASMQEMNHAVHGFGGTLCTSILDRYYRQDMSLEDSYGLLKLCVQEIQRRFILNLPSFRVRAISKDGIQELPPLTKKDVLQEA